MSSIFHVDGASVYLDETLLSTANPKSGYKFVGWGYGTPYTIKAEDVDGLSFSYIDEECANDAYLIAIFAEDEAPTGVNISIIEFAICGVVMIASAILILKSKKLKTFAK